MLSLSLLYDDAINGLSLVLFSLSLSLPCSYILLLFFLLSLFHLSFSSFQLSPFPLSIFFPTFWFNDRRLQIATEFHHKTPLCYYCPCCLLPNTHVDMQTHTHAHANMPPELIIQGNCQQIHIKTIIEKRGPRKESNSLKIGSFLFAKTQKIFIDECKSTKVQSRAVKYKGWNITCKHSRQCGSSSVLSLNTFQTNMHIHNKIDMQIQSLNTLLSK